MDKRALQLYAVWAKNNLESQIEVSLKTLGINSEHDIKEARKVGDYTIIDGDSNSYPGDLKDKRDSIVKLVKTDGYKQVIEEFAYTWFNRIVALRFMEVHDFLPHGFRVLSSRDGGVEPEIMKHLDLVKDELKLDLSVVQPLYAQGKLDEAYSYVLFRQCYALSGILPMLFDRDQDYLELLLPKALLKGETFITKLMEIGEEDFLNDVEVIGWLYQFYVADDRQAFRDAKVVTKDLIPTLTQVFTPDWIVRYMAENSVGRIWLESYPNSPLKSEMKYYVEDAKQEADIHKKIDAIKYKNVNPEDIKVIEPCCGSGHILVYVFDLLYKMYEERGYQTRDIPSLILKNNLVGLEIDKRAAQLASFSLIMRARTLNSRFFNSNYYVKPAVFEIWDVRELLQNDYEQQLTELKLLSDEEIKNIKWLVETFRYAKTVGSLLIVEKRNFDSIEKSIEKIENQAVVTIFNSNFVNEGVRCLKHLLAQARVMAKKYDVMITNPPYLATLRVDKEFQKYCVDNFPLSKDDLFAIFMEVNYVKTNGFRAILNPDSWMFIQSFDDFRLKLINNYTFINMCHLGMGVVDATVHVTSFVMRECKIDGYKTLYKKMLDDKTTYVDDFYGCESFSLDNDNYKFISQQPFGYWLSDDMFHAFKGNNIGDYCVAKAGMVTGKDDYFVKFWYEVPVNEINIAPSNYKVEKFVPYQKGGPFKRFYGNNYYVVNIKDVYDPNIAGKSVRRGDSNYYFKRGLGWSQIGTNLKKSFRVIDKTCCGTATPTLYFSDEDQLIYCLAFLNTIVSEKMIAFLNPTLNLLSTDICRMPIDFNKINSVIVEKTKRICYLAKKNWDSLEISWDFNKHFLIGGNKIKELYDTYSNESQNERDEYCEILECNNKHFIEKLGLGNEIDYKINNDDISFDIESISQSIKSLISYLIGVEMGRYSLDVEGLAYAGGEWNPMNYVTYQPDDDGIIPIYTQLGMADGLTARIIKLIKHIYGEDTYRENIEFIAEALGKNQNESAEETLNRYLNYGFYADHLKTYQKRPIYWMFSSGKNDAFKCLVYLHRYNEDTLAKINSKYFLNESARLNVEVNETRTLLEAADGREKLRLDKQMKLLNARQKEMIEYGQVLDHMANQYINLDLDDGVKVNYAKFQGIEIVNDSGAKVKKDLLVPIK